MKKLLMGAIVLFIFSSSILFLQTSCSKTQAQLNNNSVTQIGKIAFYKKWSTAAEIWTANYDGTNASQVPLTLPANVTIDGNCCTASLSVSPDGQKLFFSALNTSSGSSITELYSCNINGSNLTLIVPGTTDMMGKVVAY